MVGHEEGHKETKQFMLHSVPDRLQSGKVGDVA